MKKVIAFTALLLVGTGAYATEPNVDQPTRFASGNPANCTDPGGACYKNASSRGDASSNPNLILPVGPGAAANGNTGTARGVK